MQDEELIVSPLGSHCPCYKKPLWDSGRTKGPQCFPYDLKMTTAAETAELAQIDGASLRRFVVHSTLLCLIDPVRGRPTTTQLDENPESDLFGGLKLKQKFLDSFALICSTSSSGAETASAVCLEQHLSAETVLRVARNRGLTPQHLDGLETILKILESVARKGPFYHVNIPQGC